MLFLDTDHLVEFQRGTSGESRRLKERLDHSTDLFSTTIITVEEIMRGWLAAIHRNRDPHKLDSLQLGMYSSGTKPPPYNLES